MNEPLNPRPTVWLVEDSALEASSVGRALLGDYDLEVFAKGSSMLEAFTSGKTPDVLLLDLQLPDVGGLELCRFVRTKLDARALPILILTVLGDKPHLVEALGAGANDYLTKPAEPSELRARVKSLHHFRQLYERAARAEQLRQLAESEAELERERQGAILTYAPAAIGLFTGREHRLEFANPLFRELFAGAASLGGALQDAAPEVRHHPLFGVLGQVFSSGEPYVAQAFPLLAGQLGQRTERFLKVTYLPRRDLEGRVTGVYLFAFDITEQAVGRRKMEEMLSLASHELKTPLTSVQLHLQLLSKLMAAEPQTANTQKVRKGLQAIDRQVRRQSRLVGDLLDVSRLTAGKLRLELEELDVAELLREVVQRFVEERGTTEPSLLQLTEVEAVTAHVDRLRLDQVLTNLISNALKYGGGKPVELRAEAVGVRRMRVVVRDRGIGIEPDHLERIFAPFERAVSERHYAGMGLGLWITRRLVEAMGGTISVESAPGHGSTFTLELPRLPSRQTEEEPALAHG